MAEFIFSIRIVQRKSARKMVVQKLAEKDVYAFGDLPKDSLKVVTSDLTNGRIIVIPDDLHLYGKDWRDFSVAKALRMSCGIPFSLSRSC